MKFLSIGKRFAIATVAAAALVGPVTAAHALQFSSGDAVLVLYGNTQEYVQNLGSMSNLIANGLPTLDLSSFLTTVGPVSTLKYTIAGQDSLTSILFGDRDPLSSWTTTQINGLKPNNLIGALNGWSGDLASAGDTRSIIPAGDGLSFSSNLNASGSDTFQSTVSALHPGASGIGNVLHLLSKASPLSEVGIAMLDTTGHLTITPLSAVPVPAAVVLFASGLVGLVGLARRRMSGTHKSEA